MRTGLWCFATVVALIVSGCRQSGMSDNEYVVNGAENFVPEHRHTLWYTRPVTVADVADPWMEYALPIGNGDFGAMIYGGIRQERIQFNDKSLWTGSSTERGCYQNFGEILVEDISGDFGEDKAVTGYVRYLDLETGCAGVEYKSADGDIDYRRQYIASFPDKVVAANLSASEPGKVSVRVSLVNMADEAGSRPVYEDGGAMFDGAYELIDFKAAMKVDAVGGEVTTADDCIEVVGADEVTIVLAGMTNFDPAQKSYISDASAMRREVDDRLERAVGTGWNLLKDRQQQDHASLYERAGFIIEKADNMGLDTEALVKHYNLDDTERTDPRAMMLEELYYAYGRYLLIGSSRGMDTPANLQGLWNHSSHPCWESDIHSNINVQMNYWPAEITNLSEMHMPYLNYIYSMAVEHDEWPEYARRSGQSDGWTCFTQNNIFGHSDYAENYVIANAWYTSHMWQHYRYTLDREFLKQKAMPVMLSCARFWMERLKADGDGRLVAPAEWSPEHGPDAEDGTAHAQQIVYDLFESTLAAIDVLGDDAGVDADFIGDLKDKFAALDPGLAVEKYTGAWGESLNGVNTGDDLLREWKSSDYTAGDNGHRHQSHLMCMYPFSQVTPGSPYFDAAVNSLKLRGDHSTGWSMGWRINLWARARDGEHAHMIIKNALKHAREYVCDENAGGIYYNLLDSHAPFQIDGNFGYTAGVTELLLQSLKGDIHLLPALPSVWSEGYANGLRAENNMEVDQMWVDGRLTGVRVTSWSGMPCTLVYPGIAGAVVKDVDSDAHAKVKTSGADKITFETLPGHSYDVSRLM